VCPQTKRTHKSMAQRVAASTRPPLQVEVLRLYRSIMKTLPLLEDKAARTYYYQFARAHFIQHRNEYDDERIREILDRGKQDFVWLKNKYGIVG